MYAAEPEYGELVYGLRNLDEGFIPPVFDPSVLDGRVKVDSLKALQATRDLVAREGMFAGPSTGAALSVALRLCTPQRLAPGTKVVVLSPDGGWKYLSTGAYGADPVAAEAGLRGQLVGIGNGRVAWLRYRPRPWTQGPSASSTQALAGSPSPGRSSTCCPTSR